MDEQESNTSSDVFTDGESETSEYEFEYVRELKVCLSYKRC